jgi:hypothetical protein
MNRLIAAVVFFFLSLVISGREYPIVADKTSTGRLANEDIYFEYPHFIFSHTHTFITIKFKNPNHAKLRANDYKLRFIVNGDDQQVEFDKNGAGTLSATFTSHNKLSVALEDVTYNMELPVISIWYMLLPIILLLLALGYKIVTVNRGLRVLKKDSADINGPDKKFKIVQMNPLVEEERLDTY